MAAITLASAGKPGGAIVVSVTISAQRIGAWTADLVVGSRKVIAGAVDLHLGDNLTLTGYVSRSAIMEGEQRLQLVAGADGLRKDVKPKHYTAPSLRVVLKDLLGDVGETLSPSSDAGVLSQVVEHWTTLRMPAGMAIRLLLGKAGKDVAWRHLPDGKVWVGKETWPVSKLRDFGELSANPEERTVEFRLMTPEALPGTVLGDRKVDAIEQRVSGGSVTATVWEAP